MQVDGSLQTPSMTPTASIRGDDTPVHISLTPRGMSSVKARSDLLSQRQAILLQQAGVLSKRFASPSSGNGSLLSPRANAQEGTICMESDAERNRTTPGDCAKSSSAARVGVNAATLRALTSDVYNTGLSPRQSSDSLSMATTQEAEESSTPAPAGSCTAGADAQCIGEKDLGGTVKRTCSEEVALELVDARQQVEELEQELEDLRFEMRTHDEDAEKMLVLLHDKLAQEQEVRKVLEQEKDEHQRMMASLKHELSMLQHNSKQQQTQLHSASSSPVKASYQLVEIATSHVSSSLQRLSNLDAAQDKEREDLIAEISKLQGELRQSLRSLAEQENEVQNLEEEKDEACRARDQAFAAQDELKARAWALEVKMEKVERERDAEKMRTGKTEVLVSLDFWFRNWSLVVEEEKRGRDKANMLTAENEMWEQFQREMQSETARREELEGLMEVERERRRKIEEELTLVNEERDRERILNREWGTQREKERTELEAMRNERDDLRRELKKEQQNAEKVVDTLCAQVAQMEDGFMPLETQLQARVLELEELQSHVAKLEVSLEQQQVHNCATTQHFNEKEVERAEALEQLFLTRKQFSEERASLVASAEQHATALIVAKKECAEATEALEKANMELRQEQQEREALVIEFEQQYATALLGAAAAEALDKKNQDLQHEKQEREALILELERKESESEKVVDTLSAQVAQMEDGFMQLKTQLQARVAELEASLEQQQVHNCATTQHFNEKEVEYAEALEQLFLTRKQFSEERASLVASAEQHATALIVAKKECAEAAEALEKANMELRQEQQEREALVIEFERKHANALLMAKNESAAAAEALDKKNQDLQHEKQEREALILELERKESEFERERAILKESATKEAEAAKARIALQTNVEELAQALAPARSDLQDVQKMLQASEEVWGARVKDMEEKLKEQEALNAELYERIGAEGSELGHANSLLQADKDTLETHVKELSQQLKKATEARELLEEKAEQKSKWEVAYAVQQEEYSKLKVALDAADGRASAALRAQTTLEAEIAHLKSEMHSAKNVSGSPEILGQPSVEQLKAELAAKAALEAQVEQLKESVKKSMAQTRTPARFHVERAVLDNQDAAAVVNAAELDTHVQELEWQLATVEGTYAALLRECQALREQVVEHAAAAAAMCTMQIQFKECQKRAEQLESKIKDMEGGGEQLRLRIKKLEVERDEAQTSLALHLSLKMPVINSERGHERREEEQKDPQKSGNSKESCKDHNETLSLNMPELTVGMAGELEEEEEFFAESAKTWKEIERLQDLENSADYGGRHAYTDLDNEVIVGNDEGFIDHGHRAVEEQMTFEETSGVVTFFAESSRVWKEIEQERSLENSNRSTPVVSAPRREELFPGAGVGAGAMPREPDGVQEVSALHMSSTHNEGEGSVVGPAQRRLHFDSHVTLDRRQMASSPFSPFSPATNGWSMLFPRWTTMSNALSLSARNQTSVQRSQV